MDVAALLDSIARVMRVTAQGGGVTLGQAVAPGLPMVRGDALRLRQVLLNLVSNAVKFTPTGGSVHLDAHVEADGGLLLSVSDTGIGIEAADLPRVFEPFNQLDSSLARRFEGSGLGLHLSRALAEAQGASLTLQSAIGQGTTALLRFPPERLLQPDIHERTH